MPQNNTEEDNVTDEPVADSEPVAPLPAEPAPALGKFFILVSTSFLSV